MIRRCLEGVDFGHLLIVKTDIEVHPSLKLEGLPPRHLETKIGDFIRKYGFQSGWVVADRLQAMLALLESLRDETALDLKAHLAESGQSLKSHETLGNRAHERLALDILNKNHGRRSSNLQAWGQPMLDLLAELGFGQAAPDARVEMLDKFQQQIGSCLLSIIEEGPIRVKVQGKSIEAVVGDVLAQAEKKQKPGDVAQYLVGAKLALRFEREIPVHGANKGDRKSHADVGARLGDFEVESSIIEVAVGLPDEKHLKQIEEILDNSDREVWLLTREDRVAIWKSEASKRFSQRVGRIVVAAVESFVGQTITELGEFSAKAKIECLKELVELYNTKWVDTVGIPSIRISIE